MRNQRKTNDNFEESLLKLVRLTLLLMLLFSLEERHLVGIMKGL